MKIPKKWQIPLSQKNIGKLVFTWFPPIYALKKKKYTSDLINQYFFSNLRSIQPKTTALLMSPLIGLTSNAPNQVAPPPLINQITLKSVVAWFTVHFCNGMLNIPGYLTQFI